MPRRHHRHHSITSCVALAASIVPIIIAAADSQQLTWVPRAPCPIPGVHHPITFANETHGFLLTGSTSQSTTSSEFYIYDESNDEWMDLTSTSSAFPGEARSFGYGVVLAESNNTKAYLGFGADPNGQRLADLWEFDMSNHAWQRLPDFPGYGRRHPAFLSVRNSDTNNWEIHVGLGDTYTVEGGFANLNDWWIYDITTATWRRGPDLPSTTRHHPFYFGLNGTAYAGFGHSNSGIERDWFALPSTNNWVKDTSMASYQVIEEEADGSMPMLSDEPVTTEARVAGTQFSIELPLDNGNIDGSSTTLSGSLAFVLSGDGDDHGAMKSGEFHAFYPAGNDLMDGPDGPASSWWRQLPPHPGYSRWAPGSFVMRGTARAYFTSGYDRVQQGLYNDLWMMDLSPLLQMNAIGGTADAPGSGMDADSEDGGAPGPSGPNRDTLEAAVDNVEADSSSCSSRLLGQAYIGIGYIACVVLQAYF